MANRAGRRSAPGRDIAIADPATSGGERHEYSATQFPGVPCGSGRILGSTSGEEGNNGVFPFAGRRVIVSAGRSSGVRTAWGPDLLTRREREVAVLAARGLSNREIADILVVSVRTIENQLRRVYSKLAVGGREELAAALGRPGPMVE